MHPRRAAAEQALGEANREAIREWGHKANGTCETHAKVAGIKQGALARLYQSGAIDIEQLSAGAQIRDAYERIVVDVGIRSPNFETRVDQSRHGDMFFEALGAVWCEVAYSLWRTGLGVGREADGVLDIVVRDVGITKAAYDACVPYRRLRQRLIAALDSWRRCHADARHGVNDEGLAAAHATLARDSSR